MNDKNGLKGQWNELSQNWIREMREGRNANRKGLIDPPMLEACADVQGLNILDCGCGEGRFSRILAERGAGSVLGLDLCEPMIEAATQLQSGRDTYQVADVQNLSFLAEETFDLAISYLNQCDLSDSDANNREVFRVLKKGGRFIIANLHPMRSATGNWHRDADGEKLHVVLDNYFDEAERHWKMMGVEFTNFHRTLSTSIGGFLDAGFLIAGVLEPTVSEDQLVLYPELDDELRVPNFIIYVLQKL